MNRVQDKGLQPNAYLHTCLINAYSRAKEYENCEKAFYKMLRSKDSQCGKPNTTRDTDLIAAKTLPTVVTLNALLAARTQALQDGYRKSHYCNDIESVTTEMIFSYGQYP